MSVVVFVVEYLFEVRPLEGVAEVDEVWVQDYLVKVKSSVNHNPGKAYWSIACDVCCLVFYVLAVCGASNKLRRVCESVSALTYQLHKESRACAMLLFRDCREMLKCS